MAVSFVQTVPFWPTSSAVSPQTSTSFTPTAGNFLVGINNDDSTNGSTLTLNGSVNNLTLGATQNDAGNANTAAIFGLNSISGGSQTLTVARSGGGNFLYGAAFEFSGVTADTYVTNVCTSSAGVKLGTSVSAPVGSIVIAWLKFDSGAGLAITAQADNVSSIAANALISGNVSSNYCVAYWVGAGTNIQPKFLEASSGASTGIIVQALLTPAGSPTINTQPVTQVTTVGGTCTFTVSATASSGALSYQWQTYNVGTGSWSSVGTNSSSYTTGTLSSSDEGTYVNVLVTDSNGTIESNRAAMYLTGLPSDSKGDSPFSSVWIAGR